MKKIIIAFLLCLSSVAAYSGAPTCRVYGTNTIATLSYFNKVNDSGVPRFEVQVSLTDPQSTAVVVVVEAYQDNNFVGSTTVTISPNKKWSDRGDYYIFLNDSYDPNGGHVNVQIATASCQ